MGNKISKPQARGFPFESPIAILVRELETTNSEINGHINTLHKIQNRIDVVEKKLEVYQREEA